MRSFLRKHKVQGIDDLSHGQLYRKVKTLNAKLRQKRTKVV